MRITSEKDHGAGRTMAGRARGAFLCLPLLVLLWLAPSTAFAEPPLPQARLKYPGWIIVTPRGPVDGGDFGPLTEETKTAGIQEALDAARRERRDVHIAGGAMPAAFQNGAVYALRETVRVPWMQDFRLDGGEAVLDYGLPEGDAIIFDSLMSCRIKIGLVVCHSSGVAMRLQPRTKGPDDFSVITTCTFEVNALVGGGSVFPVEGMRGKGTGLLFDGAAGSINDNRFMIQEIVACDTALDLRQGTNNWIEVPFAHLSNSHLSIGPAAARNRVAMTIDGQGIRDSVGAVIRGRSNLLTLDVTSAGAERGLIFEADARDNVVTAMGLAGGITNRAKVPNNRVIPMTAAGFEVATPPVPASGETATNRTSMSIEAMILKPGETSCWTLTDAGGKSQAFEGTLHPGLAIRLEPGDSIRFDYRAAPNWRWRGIR